MVSVRGLSLILAGLLVLGAAACGGDDDGGPPPTTGAVPATTATPATDVPTTTDDPTTTTTTDAPTTTDAAPTQTVTVWFSAGDGSDCAEVAPVRREVPADADPLWAALDELTGGPTPDEQAGGAGSFFSERTSGTVLDVSVVDGLAIVDLADLTGLIPNASTSCGSMALVAQLRATVFEDPSVSRVQLRMFDSCDGFWEWMQGECRDLTRDGGSVEVATVERASGSGCAPPDGDQLPDGRWFGRVEGATADAVEFDLACWFSGIAAAVAAAEDGEESPPPNDYHVRNASPVVRVLPVAPDAEVRWLPNPGGPDLAPIDVAAWLAVESNRELAPGVWLTVSDGEVTRIVEQYVP